MGRYAIVPTERDVLMPWILAGVVFFLIFATKTGGARSATLPGVTVQPVPTPQNPSSTVARTPVKVTTPVAATGGGLVATIAAWYGYASKAYSYVKTAYQGIQYGTKAVTAVTETSAEGISGADTAGGIDATVNVGLGAAAGSELTATGEIGGTAVSYIAGSGSEVVASVVGEAAAGVIGTAAVGVGFIALALIIKELVNLGLNDYKTGQLSKEIMRQRQIYIMQHGAANVEEAIAAAATFTDAMGILAHAPLGTSGQVQFGIGNEYAGMHYAPGRAGTTETPNWNYITQAMGDPATLREHPEAIANFIANLWVQTGPGGQTSFDQHSTFLFRLNLLAKLPYTPEWNYIRTLILNMELVDPRNILARDAAIAALVIPPEDEFVRIGWARVPTNRVYQYYDVNTSPPSYKPASPEILSRLAGISCHGNRRGTDVYDEHGGMGVLFRLVLRVNRRDA